jgi:site-specific DNA-methyltransferase (adenine-specific)
MIDLRQGDCLEIMPTLAAQSVDAIITDLPYGTTACKWDTVIPFAPMWAEVERLLKPRGAFVTTASQPFTSALVMSNLEWFKYCWVWDKRLAGNGILADIQPLKIHEDICVFSRNGHTYNAQNMRGKPRYKGGITDRHGTFSGASSPIIWSVDYHPVSIVEFSGAGMRKDREHPTQKPVALLEYLIRTYTNAGDTVLDFCMGSGTTGLACVNTGRSFMGIERESEYVAIATRRITEAQAQLPLLEAR